MLPLTKLETTHHYSIVVIASLLLAWILYGLWPIWPGPSGEHPLGIQLVWIVQIGILGLLGFYKYWQLCLKKPYLTLLLVALLIPFRTFITGILASVGIGVMVIMLPMAVFCLPGLASALSQVPTLLRRVPYFKYMLFLCALVLVYFLFHDNEVYDNYANQSLSFRTCFAVTFNFITILLAGSLFYTTPSPGRLFDRFNGLLFWLGGLFSVLVIGAYPFHIFTVPVEGMERTTFIFSVPSQFAFYMSFLSIYFLGIYFYYRSLGVAHFRYTRFLPAMALLVAVAMLTSLLKNAAFTVVLAGLLILACHYLRTRAGWYRLASNILGIGALLWIGLMLLQVMTDISVIDLLAQRFENNNSLLWRFNVWNYLLDDILSESPETWLTGFGLSAASAKMKIMEGFNATDSGIVYQVLYPHNDFLAYFYDMGIGGLLIFISLIGLIIRTGISIWTTQASTPKRSLDITLLAILISFMIFCATDNLFNMVESPFWLLTTMLFVISDRLSIARGQQA